MRRSSLLAAAAPTPRTRHRPPRGAAGKHRNLHIALCTKSKERPALVVPGKPWLATEPVPGDAPSARWEATAALRALHSGRVSAADLDVIEPASDGAGGTAPVLLLPGQSR
jgi:hypothetical protein